MTSTFLITAVALGPLKFVAADRAWINYHHEAICEARAHFAHSPGRMELHILVRYQ